MTENAPETDVVEKVLTNGGSHVHMHNPETGGNWECPVGYAPIAETRGWVYSQPADHSLDGLFDPTPPVLTDFEPAEHTVAEVNAHLEKYAASAEEVARVLELERSAEKPRTSVNGI